MIVSVSLLTTQRLLFFQNSSATVPGIWLGLFWGKQHPLEERVCVFQVGQQQTISRTLACSLPRGPGGGVWLIVYLLLTLTTGENKAAWLWEVAQQLGAADNSWRRQIQRLATAGTQLEVAITTKRSSQYQNLQCPESVALTLGSGSSGLCLLCLSCDPLYRGPQRHLLKTRDCENEPGMHRSSCYNLKALDQKPEDLGSGSKTTWSKSLWTLVSNDASPTYLMVWGSNDMFHKL